MQSLGRACIWLRQEDEKADRAGFWKLERPRAERTRRIPRKLAGFLYVAPEKQLSGGRERGIPGPFSESIRSMPLNHGPDGADFLVAEKEPGKAVEYWGQRGGPLAKPGRFAEVSGRGLADAKGLPWGRRPRARRWRAKKSRGKSSPIQQAGKWIKIEAETVQ